MHSHYSGALHGVAPHYYLNLRRQSSYLHLSLDCIILSVRPNTSHLSTTTTTSAKDGKERSWENKSDSMTRRREPVVAGATVIRVSSYYLQGLLHTLKACSRVARSKSGGRSQPLNYSVKAWKWDASDGGPDNCARFHLEDGNNKCANRRHFANGTLYRWC